MTSGVGDEPAEASERVLRLFGADIVDTRLADAAAWMILRARHRLPTTIAFLNAHCVNVLYHNPSYRAAVNSMTRLFADGIGMRIAARAGGNTLADNVNGTDLFPVLCHQASEAGVSLYLLGGETGIAAAAGERMRGALPDLTIAGSHHGFISAADEEARVIAEINASGAGILLVGMGVPAQEAWIARNRSRLDVPVVIGVGGLFDYYSGRIPRAPLMLRKMGLEWAWRLALEPRRLARRYLLGNVEFLARLAWQQFQAVLGVSRQRTT